MNAFSETRTRQQIWENLIGQARGGQVREILFFLKVWAKICGFESLQLNT